MTIFLQLIRPAESRGTYWTAWIDPAHKGIGLGRTKKEAIGDLLLLLASKDRDEVEIRNQPAADYRPHAKGGAR